MLVTTSSSFADGIAADYDTSNTILAIVPISFVTFVILSVILTLYFLINVIFVFLLQVIFGVIFTTCSSLLLPVMY